MRMKVGNSNGMKTGELEYFANLDYNFNGPRIYTVMLECIARRIKMK